MPAFPAPDRGCTSRSSWDETRGIRFYVDGRLVAQQDGTAIFDAALDQFGPHSRIISPYQVQSAYNFVRGGDIDELRIYDRMLSDDNVASLAKGDAPPSVPPLARTLDTPRVARRVVVPLRLEPARRRAAASSTPRPSASARSRSTTSYDLKRWWWKGTDGIRETTWPGVYNRSRLPGRNDYFQLPDWDCYSLSGKSVTFTMPDEPWNQIEVSGAAFGSAFAGPHRRPAPVFERPKGQERTFHRLLEPGPRRDARRSRTSSRKRRSASCGAYYVTAGGEPEGIGTLTYRLTARRRTGSAERAAGRSRFINGRYAPDERATMVALPRGRAAHAARRRVPRAALPIVHILIPADFRDADLGARRAPVHLLLDEHAAAASTASRSTCPPLSVKPTHGAYVPAEHPGEGSRSGRCATCSTSACR